MCWISVGFVAVTILLGYFVYGFALSLLGYFRGVGWLWVFILLC